MLQLAYEKLTGGDPRGLAEQGEDRICKSISKCSVSSWLNSESLFQCVQSTQDPTQCLTGSHPIWVSSDSQAQLSAPKVSVELWAQIMLRHVQILPVKLQCFKTVLSAHKKKYVLRVMCIHAGIQAIPKASEALQLWLGQYKHPHGLHCLGNVSSLCSLRIPRCSIAVQDYFILNSHFHCGRWSWPY